jgi:hypothetical protein
MYTDLETGIGIATGVLDGAWVVETLERRVGCSQLGLVACAWLRRGLALSHEQGSSKII